jgi:gliding motility-associated-like protein
LRKTHYIFIFCLLCLLTLLTNRTFAGGYKFIENKGQWPEHILFKADLGGGVLYVQQTGLYYVLYDALKLHEVKHGEIPDQPIPAHAIRITFQGGQFPAQIQHYKPSAEYFNYFIGSNASRWQTDVRAWQHIVLKDIYPGIDFEFLAEDQQLKYNFIVNAGADISKIKLKYEGQSSLALQNGELKISNSVREIMERKPFAHFDAGSKKEISCKFSLNSNVVSFQTEQTSFSQRVIIDPEVIFATYSGSQADNFGFSATYDNQGNTYSAGNVFDVGFPTTPGAFQVNYQGGSGMGTDVAILKYNPSGTGLIYATYLGGKLHDEQPHSLIVNSKNELVIMGTTSSSDFPVSATGYDKSFNGSTDIFVTILSTAGNALRGSTYLGDVGIDGLNGKTNNYSVANAPLAYNYGDNYRGEVLVDKNDNIYIYTSSRSASITLNTSAGTVSYTRRGTQYAMLASFNPTVSVLQRVRFIDGTGHVAGYGLNFNADQSQIYLCGGTTTGDVFTTSNGYQNTYAGGTADGYLMRIETATFTTLSSTFFGTSTYDQIYFVQVEESTGRVYVTGQTDNTNFVSTAGVYKVNLGGIFISAFNSDLSSLIYSTTIGSNAAGNIGTEISPSAFLIDRCGNVSFSGWGGETNNNYNSATGKTTGMPISTNAYQQNTDGSDFYILVMSGKLDKVIYATYFGGPQSEEHVDGGTSRFDDKGIVYQSVCGGCRGFSDFPTSTSAWSRTNNSFNCNNATFKINLNNSLKAPVFLTDTFLTVYATDSIYYPFSIFDPDQDDSVFFSYSGKVFNSDSTGGNPARIIGPTKGKKNLSAALVWGTKCVNARADTMDISISIRDNACPDQKFAFGRIRILVKPIPDVLPPELSCIKSIDSNTTQLVWTADKSVNQRFFKQIVMNKVFPDESLEAPFHQMTQNIDDSLIDLNTPQHKLNDFCYYMYGVNVCNKNSDTTRFSCTKLYPDTAAYNPFDMAMDTVLTAMATDSFYYNFTIKSKKPRKYTLKYEFSGEILAPGNISVNTGKLEGSGGIDEAWGKISWKPLCQDLREDTFTIHLLVWDNACPVPNSRTNRIHIRVVPPPSPAPPTFYCVKKLNDNSVRVRWEYDTTDKFFAYHLLYRKSPSGEVRLLGKFMKGEVLEFIDNTAIAQNFNNYCYYAKGVNICDIPGDTSDPTCTLLDPKFSPGPVNMNYVTVVDNKEVEVRFTKSKEKLIEQYRIYKRPNDPDEQFLLYQVFDTSFSGIFTDTAVNVKQQSYCYQATLFNECGLESKEAFEHCTILLKGESLPFRHNLRWNPYTYWKLPTENYRLKRTDPFIPELDIETISPLKKETTDTSMYDDCGLYYYRVVARENAKSTTSFESSSNTIELIQKPLLFVPTAFSPNGDGLNDDWLNVPSFVKTFNLKLFNRWGEMIFETNDRHFRWDGTFKSNREHDDVFVYLITYSGWDNKMYVTSGDVTMIR